MQYNPLLAGVEQGIVDCFRTPAAACPTTIFRGFTP
jgi:hypothetical protein